MMMERLFKQLDEQVTGLAHGTIDPKRANALCNSAGKMIGIVRVNIETAKLLGLKPNLKAFGLTDIKKLK